MEKYIVKRWFNNVCLVSWHFPNRKWAKAFYKRKKEGLNDERKNQNKIRKLENEDERGYTRYDIKNDYEEFYVHKKWKDVKNED